MKIAESGVDYVAAPADYADLHSRYYRYVVRLVQRAGIHRDGAEDVASEILLRFMERDFLAVFDPTKEFTYQGEMRPARFKNFLTQFVLLYVRGFYDKQQRVVTRELLICDMPVSTATADSQSSDRAATWLDVFGGAVDDHQEDVLDRFDEEKWVDALRCRIALVPRRSKYDNCDLVDLFDAVVEQVREYNTVHIGELREQFNVSVTAMHSWLWWLKENLCVLLNRPVPPKRSFDA